MSGDLPATERANPLTADLDLLATPDLVRVLIRDQARAAQAVLDACERLAEIVDEVARRLRAGGRLHYVGAGTSGRLGALDAAEMPPTFGTAPETVCAHLAGGSAALTGAVEGAEDDGEAGVRTMDGHVVAGDAVVGVSASGGAPFVVSALARARALDAYAVAIVANGDSALAREADAVLVLATGAEALTGSTRLTAGTAQKIALNTLSTAVMVRLGKVHGNAMADVVVTNAKLRARAQRLVTELADVDAVRAGELLERAGGRVKLAVVMARRSVEADAARTLLEKAGGSLRATFSEVSR